MIPYEIKVRELDSLTVVSLLVEKRKIGHSCWNSHVEEGSCSINLLTLETKQVVTNVCRVGTVLMKAMIEKSIEHDCSVIMHAYKEAVPFYAKLGFCPTSDNVLKRESKRLPILVGILTGRCPIEDPKEMIHLRLPEKSREIWMQAIGEGQEVLKNRRDELLEESGFPPRLCATYNIQRVGRAYLSRGSFAGSLSNPFSTTPSKAAAWDMSVCNRFL